MANLISNTYHLPYYQQIFIKGSKEHTSLQITHKICATLQTKVRPREVKISHEHSEKNEKIEFNDGDLQASLCLGEKKREHKNCLVLGRNLLLP